MIENLKQLIKENVQDAIVNNSAVPNEKNEAAIEATSGSIIEALKGKLASGDLSGLVNIFKNGDSGAVAQQASSGLTEKLAGLGINLESAKSIAASVMPGIMDKFVKKTNDPNDSSFNIQDVLGKISGEDGKFELSDLTRLYNEKTDVNGDGKDDSLIDKVKGLFS